MSKDTVNLLDNMNIDDADKIGQDIVIEKLKASIVVTNNSDTDQLVRICNYVKCNKKGRFLNFVSKGVLENGECTFIIGVSPIPLNSTVEVPLSSINIYSIFLKLKPNTKLVLNRLEYSLAQQSIFEQRTSESDTLIISPGYPQSYNLYSFGFVHTSTKGYTQTGMKVDIFCENLWHYNFEYEFDGVKVLYNSLSFLKGLLHRSSYKRVIIHFLDEKLLDLINSVLLYYGIPIYVFIHGAEVLYNQQRVMCTRYDGSHNLFFDNKKIIRMDYMYHKLANSNVNWLFVSKWLKDEAERLIGVKFTNSYIIPNGLDTRIFPYQPKRAENRLNIFTLRKFEDINKYSLDIVIKTILVLQHKDFFDKLTFYIYGDGPLFDKFSQMLPYANVKFNRGFFTHKQISGLHKNCGIVFHPTRLDAMGCSSLEAVCSGLVLISSNTTAIPEFISPEYGTLSNDIENPISYAEIIERLYFSSDRFLELSSKMSREISEKYSRDIILKQELALFANETGFVLEQPLETNIDHKILSICIPVYNIERYLIRCLNSILSCKDKHLLEIIIVNDGSTDNSSQVIDDYYQRFPHIIKVITQENQGHGSAVIAGLRSATAKYFRIIDGDDWVDPIALNELLQYLRFIEVDLVLTNYSVDHISNPNIYPNLIYNNLPEQKKLDIESIKFTDVWGPILSTSTVKTTILQESQCNLPTKCCYVDMLYNARVIAAVQTLIYLNLPIYKYFIGRAEQSISAGTFVSKYQDHEKVILEIMGILQNPALSSAKKALIRNHLLLPMLGRQIFLFISMRSLKKMLKFLKQFKLQNAKSEYKVHFSITNYVFKNVITSRLLSLVKKLLKNALLLPYSLGKYTYQLLKMYNITLFDKHKYRIEKALLLPKKWE